MKETEAGTHESARFGERMEGEEEEAEEEENDLPRGRQQLTMTIKSLK